MSKQAIALLQAERDALMECSIDFGGRMSDEDSSTLAQYDEAIAAIEKLMLNNTTLTAAVEMITNFLRGINQPATADSLQAVLNLVDGEPA